MPTISQDLLTSLLEYFEARQDISYDDPNRPNEEMKFVTILQKVEEQQA